MHAEKYTIFLALDQDATVGSTLDNTAFLSLDPMPVEGLPSVTVVSGLPLALTVDSMKCLVEEFEVGKGPLFCVCSVEEGANVECFLV